MILRKCLSIVLSVCLSVTALPGFSAVPDTEAAALTRLSDAELNEVVGAGQLDATIADHRVSATGHVSVVAVLANRSGISSPYFLEALDTGGNVLAVLASGTVFQNQALVVNGQYDQATTDWSTVRIVFGSGVLNIRAEESSVLLPAF